MSRTDFPPARGRVGLAVALAAIFLAVIGASLGVAAGFYTKPTPSAQSTYDPSGSTDGEQGSDDGATPGAGETTGGGSTATGGSASDHDQCPSVTVTAAVNAGAKKPLSRVIYVKTVDDNGNDSSEVWICKDAKGELFYQGHSMQKGSLDSANSDHTLFLTSVDRDGDGWSANNNDNNGTTTYHVTTSQLKVIASNGSHWVERVTEHSP